MHKEPDYYHIDHRYTVPENPRSRYSRCVNWRPADGEKVTLNPPRISWPYPAEWPDTWSERQHIFTLRISLSPDCSDPIIEIDCTFNFYNTLPALEPGKTYYWQVGYDVGTAAEQWSEIFSFAVDFKATEWDRSLLVNPQLGDHPRVLLNERNFDTISDLYHENPSSRAALDHMLARAKTTLQKEWWQDFPESDRNEQPEENFYVIAEELASMAFVWKITGDQQFAGVKERAVTWASYPPGGRSSPEGLGGDSRWSEDATKGTEFLALLFDWLYSELTFDQRQVMIRSLEWRVDHMMNNFVWKSNASRGPLREALTTPDTGLQAAADTPVPGRSLAGCCSSHQYEGSMDTAVCGLVLYGHSEVGSEWFELMLNYLIGVTCGFGFDEAWNEGAGYGSSKLKWLMNASIYYDTALQEANLGKNPFYARIGEFFSRLIPVGMQHNAWGNQANASPRNHLATFRKLAYLTGRGTFLLNWQEYGGKKFSDFRPWIEYCLPAYYKRPEPRPEEETTAVFDIGGWAMASTGPPSRKESYSSGAGVIFQCRPRGGYSHAFHSDGSFQLHAFGEMLNHGGGSSANRDAYAYHTMSHNTILIDGLGQAQPSSRMPCPAYARITGFAQKKDLVYMAGDLTRAYPREPGDYSRWSLPLGEVYQKRALPYLEHFVRHILFVKGRYFVIFDQLSCSRPATYTWLYHILPKEPLSFDPEQCVVDYRVGDVEIQFRHFFCPDQLELENRRGMQAFINPMTGEDYRKQSQGEPLAEHNLWISNTEPKTEWNFMAVVYPRQQGEKKAEMASIDDCTVRIDNTVISFDPQNCTAEEPDILIEPDDFHGF